MSIIELNQNYYYSNLIDDAFDLEITYPSLVSTSIIGRSHDFRDILMIKVGRGSKAILCTGGVHGRESINPVVMMKIIETYCDLARKGEFLDEFSLHALLNEFSIYFIPILNPDGYMIALRGFNVIKNEKLRIHAKSLQIPYQEWKLNARGMDINRNFPSKYWKKKFDDDYAASELETKALIDLFNQYQFGGYLDIHSRGKMIYYHRGSMDTDYNIRQIRIANYLKSQTNYVLAPVEEEIEISDSGGNTVHYFSEQFHRPAITIETVADEETFPLDVHNQKPTFEELLKCPIGFLVKVFTIQE